MEWDGVHARTHSVNQGGEDAYDRVMMCWCQGGMALRCDGAMYNRIERVCTHCMARRIWEEHEHEHED